MSDAELLAENASAETTQPGTALVPSPNSYQFANSITVLNEPEGVQAESIRALRTNILAQHIRDGRRSLAICSASAGTGCSFVSANLAVSMAQAGVKTLLIDANMREPGLNAYIRAEHDTPGLYQCLSDRTLHIGSAIHDDVLPGLSVMFAGAGAGNAQELLAGTDFKGLIDNLLRDFDLTIVDTPPANMFADARRVATVLRYALIVARKDMSFVADVKALAEELQADRARVIGTFLNDF